MGTCVDSQPHSEETHADYEETSIPGRSSESDRPTAFAGYEYLGMTQIATAIQKMIVDA